VYVDGQFATGDPTTLELFAHEEIVMTYGTEAELPDPIPSSYAPTGAVTKRSFEMRGGKV
jgi:hypothetical protein